MKKLFLILAIVALAAGLATSAFAAAANPRPVAMNGAALQGYFDGIGESIDVYTDQQPWALWQTTASNNSTFTLMLEAAGFAAGNRFGIYNDGNTGSLFEVFAGPASAGWKALASFNSGGTYGKLVVNLFDDQTNYMGQNIYFNVNSSNFGFYLDSSSFGGGGLFFSEDDENADNLAHNLVYAGTGANTGQWWLGWEDLYGGGDLDYDDMLVFAESINPVPEPGTLMLLGFGLGGMALGLRIRRRRS